jgi:hypothetical protein
MHWETHCNRLCKLNRRSQTNPGKINTGITKEGKISQIKGMDHSK